MNGSRQEGWGANMQGAIEETSAAVALWRNEYDSLRCLVDDLQRQNRLLQSELECERSSAAETRLALIADERRRGEARLEAAVEELRRQYASEIAAAHSVCERRCAEAARATERLEAELRCVSDSAAVAERLRVEAEGEVRRLGAQRDEQSGLWAAVEKAEAEANAEASAAAERAEEAEEEAKSLRRQLAQSRVALENSIRSEREAADSQSAAVEESAAASRRCSSSVAI
eukprot:Hpha_TRINITY_DN3056_c0_g1::TRINITY_DN3056_c0_g1_i1::g.138707::m.138707